MNNTSYLTYLNDMKPKLTNRRISINIAVNTPVDDPKLKAVMESLNLKAVVSEPIDDYVIAPSKDNIKKVITLLETYADRNTSPQNMTCLTLGDQVWNITSNIIDLSQWSDDQIQFIYNDLSELVPRYTVEFLQSQPLQHIYVEWTTDSFYNFSRCTLEESHLLELGFNPEQIIKDNSTPIGGISHENETLVEALMTAVGIGDNFMEKIQTADDVVNILKEIGCAL